jgi:UDP-glucose 4-epimerase
LKTILITGGAGYLGLNIALELIKTKNNVVIIDDLKNSYKSHVNKLLKTFPNNTWFYKGNVCDYEFTKNIFNSHKIDYVLHLASLKYVGESIKKPKTYEKNNLYSLKTILSL